MSEKAKDMLALAFSVALLPPLWAVAAPYIGVQTGAVALICAGVYAANGNQKADAWKIMNGFLLGDVWAVVALWLMSSSEFPANMTTFVVLAVLGALAVAGAAKWERFIFLPAWLCGWAIGLTIMTPEALQEERTLPIQIAVAMIVGIWYVGAGVDALSRLLRRKKDEKKEKADGNRI